MSSREKQPDNSNLNRIVSEALKYREQREKTYRERALNIFPHICGWCGREFSGPKLRELTVHHKDYNHDNNPPDGSNWELLCTYCHEHVHSRNIQADYGEATPGSKQKPLSTFRPFADLEALLKSEEGPVSDETDKDV